MATKPTTPAASGKKQPASGEKKTNVSRRAQGEGGLSWSESDQRWIGSVELSPHPVTGKRRRRRVTDRDYNKALKKLQKAKREEAKGIVHVPQGTNNRMRAWLLHWIEDIHRPNISPNTLKSYRRMIKLHIIPAIGNIKINALTLQDVRDMDATIIKNTASGKSRQAQLCHAILSKAMNDAIAEGLITYNPAAHVKRPKSVPESAGALDRNEAMALLQNCLEREDRMTTRFAAALMLGGRQGELLGLEWDRLNLDLELWDCSWQLQRVPKIHGCEGNDTDGYECEKKYAPYCPKAQWEVPPGFEFRHIYKSLCMTRPKTHDSKRMIPMPSELAETLRAHREMTKYDPNPYGLVWTQPNGNPISPEQDGRAWKNALREAGLEHRVLHAARHTTASLLLEGKVDKQIIMQILGHSVMTTTEGYAHVRQELAKESIATLGGLLRKNEAA